MEQTRNEQKRRWRLSAEGLISTQMLFQVTMSKHLINAVVLTQTLWEIVVPRSTSVTPSSDDVRLATALASVFVAAERFGSLSDAVT